MTAQDERVSQILDGWEFWQRNLPRPWPRGIAQEVADHDGAPEPQAQPVDIAGTSMEEYIQNRDKLGVKDSNGILGTEVRPWQRTTPTRSTA